MSSLPLQLVGRLDDADARLIVQLELDARTGEVISISGGQDAIRRTCSIARSTIDLTPEAPTKASADGARRGVRRVTPLGLSSTARLSDEEARQIARPSNILAALRRHPERSSLRLADDA